jgi:hypothetical protein
VLRSRSLRSTTRSPPSAYAKGNPDMTPHARHLGVVLIVALILIAIATVAAHILR